MFPNRSNQPMSSAGNEKSAIPDNCSATPVLSPALRDLADLLADIAVRRLKTTDQPHPEGLGENP